MSTSRLRDGGVQRARATRSVGLMVLIAVLVGLVMGAASVFNAPSANAAVRPAASVSSVAAATGPSILPRDEDADKKDYSLYRLASSVSAYFGNTISPGGDNEGRLPQSWSAVAWRSENAGAMLGFPDSQKSTVWGWFMSKISNSSVGYSYDMLKPGRIKVGDGGSDDSKGLRYYAQFGATLSDLGLDQAAPGSFSPDKMIRAGSGALMQVAFLMTVTIGMVFGMFIRILGMLNPFSLMVSGVKAVTPESGTGAGQTTLGNSGTNPLLGLTQLFGGIYAEIASWTWVVIVPTMIGLFLFNITILNRSKNLSRFKRLGIRLAFFSFAIPLFGMFYTATLDQMASSDAQKSPQANAARAVASTYVDFEDWAMKNRLAVPASAGAVIQWNKATNAATGDSRATLRNTALAINTSTGSFGDMGQIISSTAAGTSEQKADAWNAEVANTTASANESTGSESIIGNTEAISAVSNMLVKYMKGTTVSSAAFESGVKAEITRLNQDQGIKSDTINKWFIDYSKNADALKDNATSATNGQTDAGAANANDPAKTCTTLGGTMDMVSVPPKCVGAKEAQPVSTTTPNTEAACKAAGGTWTPPAGLTLDAKGTCTGMKPPTTEQQAEQKAAQTQAANEKASTGDFNPLLQVAQDSGLKGTESGDIVNFSTPGTTIANECGYTILARDGGPAACNLSAVSMYNYLNTNFSTTEATVYSGDQSSSGATRDVHYAVNQIGTGSMKMIYFLSTLTLMICFCCIGYGYAGAMFLSQLKNIVKMMFALPGASLGAMQAIVKFIVYALMLIINLIGTYYLFMFAQEMLLGLPQVFEASLSNYISQDAGVLSFIGGMTGGFGVMVFIILSTLLAVGITVVAMRVRSSLLKGVDAGLTQMIERFAETTAEPRVPNLAQRMGAAAADGIGRGAGMAAGSALAGAAGGPLTRGGGGLGGVTPTGGGGRSGGPSGLPSGGGAFGGGGRILTGTAGNVAGALGASDTFGGASTNENTVEGGYFDENGQFIDTSGNLFNEDGQRVDSAGNVIDGDTMSDTMSDNASSTNNATSSVSDATTSNAAFGETDASTDAVTEEFEKAEAEKAAGQEALQSGVLPFAGGAATSSMMSNSEASVSQASGDSIAEGSVVDGSASSSNPVATSYNASEGDVRMSSSDRATGAEGSAETAGSGATAAQGNTERGGMVAAVRDGAITGGVSGVRGGTAGVATGAAAGAGMAAAGVAADAARSRTSGGQASSGASSSTQSVQSSKSSGSRASTNTATPTASGRVSGATAAAPSASRVAGAAGQQVAAGTTGAVAGAAAGAVAGRATKGATPSAPASAGTGRTGSVPGVRTTVKGAGPGIPTQAAASTPRTANASGGASVSRAGAMPRTAPTAGPSGATGAAGARGVRGVSAQPVRPTQAAPARGARGTSAAAGQVIPGVVTRSVTQPPASRTQRASGGAPTQQPRAAAPKDRPVRPTPAQPTIPRTASQSKEGDES